MLELLGVACVVLAPAVFDVFADVNVVDVGVAVLVVVVVAVVVAAVVWAALQEGSALGRPGSCLSPLPLPPPRIMDRSSLEKLELRMET